MKKLFLLVITLAPALLAQEGIQVNSSIGPPLRPFTKLNYYTGSDLIYTCLTASVQPSYRVSVGASTLTSIVVLTNVGTVNWTAHGLAVGNLITVSGATVDIDLNGTYYVQTVPGADSFTITTAAVADATYTEATLAVSTTAPRNNAAIWSIQKFTYDTGKLTVSQWANGTTSMVHKCSDRATNTGASKIAYQ